MTVSKSSLISVFFERAEYMATETTTRWPFDNFAFRHRMILWAKEKRKCKKIGTSLGTIHQCRTIF